MKDAAVQTEPAIGPGREIPNGIVQPLPPRPEPDPVGRGRGRGFLMRQRIREYMEGMG